MTTLDFEHVLHLQGYTTRRYTRECSGTAALTYSRYVVHLVDVLRRGVLIATYDEVIIAMLFTPQNVGVEIERAEK